MNVRASAEVNTTEIGTNKKFSAVNVRAMKFTKKKKGKISKNYEDKKVVDISTFQKSFAMDFMKCLKYKLNDKSLRLLLNQFKKLDEGFYDPVTFYKKSVSLMDKYEQLRMGLLAFLQPHHAAKIGKSDEYISVKNSLYFLYNLRICVTKHPERYKKALSKIVYMFKNDIITTKNLIDEAGILFGDSILKDKFLRLFPRARPPESFIPSDSFEEINLDSDPTCEAEFIVLPSREAIPLSQSPTSVNSCIYNCMHHAKNPNCSLCNVKFVNGKIYVQKGRNLKPATLVYDNIPEEDRLKIFCGKDKEELVTSKINSKRKMTVRKAVKKIAKKERSDQMKKNDSKESKSNKKMISLSKIRLEINNCKQEIDIRQDIRIPEPSNFKCRMVSASSINRNSNKKKKKL